MENEQKKTEPESWEYFWSNPEKVLALIDLLFLGKEDEDIMPS